ncbi:MAG: hypothetical protein IT163_11425 [Bryobacterales bacterium]|nr:hypothetical protein [Bryobacterales bacterium]
MTALTIEALCAEARKFAEIESAHAEPSLYGVTDGKAVGTYLEHKFRAFLTAGHDYTAGNSASGIDFPELGVDMKVTSIKQPQSSCPFKSARQKIFGLGYALIVFVYNKVDNAEDHTGTLSIEHTIFVEKERTADFQMTRGLRLVLDSNGNEDDLVAFMADKMLPVEEIEAHNIAQELLAGADMRQGYLTISNALQWRLQYSRIIAEAGAVEGIIKVR